MKIIHYLEISVYFSADFRSHIFYRINNYPPNFIDSCTKSFRNNFYTSKAIVQNLVKWDVFIKSPFLGSSSFRIRAKLQKLFTENLTSSGFKFGFIRSFREKTYFSIKSKLPCRTYMEIYVWWPRPIFYGKIKRNFRSYSEKRWRSTAMNKHQPKAVFMSRPLSIYWRLSFILRAESNGFKPKIMRNLLIECDKAQRRIQNSVKHLRLNH